MGSGKWLSYNSLHVPGPIIFFGNIFPLKCDLGIFEEKLRENISNKFSTSFILQKSNYMKGSILRGKVEKAIL